MSLNGKWSKFFLKGRVFLASNVGYFLELVFKKKKKLHVKI
jgi:hypothetical protein